MFFPYFNYNNWIYLILDSMAIIFTVFSFFFAKKNNVLMFPVGILSSMIYSYLTYKNFLYGNFIINMYYIVIIFYGWYLCIFSKKYNDKKIPITFCNKKDYFHTLILFLFTCIFIIMVRFLNKNNEKYFHWANIIILGLYFSGMYQMAIKKVENWIFWIIGNILSVSIYFFKGFFFTEILFIILILLSVEGLFIWKKKARSFHIKNEKNDNRTKNYFN
ncbi:nicotinamide riboside transporter PnuC [Blattabacterium cuenoti]|uniref:nicotinamide riboside transporter PnuC n=1 Tax=Blattabacterium cuenoti TaxID=1653831 RepID=UPI00163BC8EF|nr:nicotinamide riboside transporter PnuC [Blattabacterium cuenoti]